MLHEKKLEKVFRNSIGMSMLPIDSGKFLMGQNEGGEKDEMPVHSVKITHPFHMSATAVTNAQYEQYDSSHAELRGAGPTEGPLEDVINPELRVGYSFEDDEAVLMVTWEDACGFCEWLTRKEGILYRLPTEAEWEYACRAGTTTPFYTGESLPEDFHANQKKHNRDFSYGPVSLLVGQRSPNAFGLYDMHGIVEEWCSDWYGFYTEEKDPIVNPQGPTTGISQIWAKVSRGGSHHTSEHDLRSASRMGAHPESRSWFIGFRIVAEMNGTDGKRSEQTEIVYQLEERNQKNVNQTLWDWTNNPMIKDMSKPYFTGPIPFVVKPFEGDSVPFFPHNHCPALTWCANGDLLACWFSTEDERGRGMVILASRLRAGESQWEPASLFFDVPDRNPTGSALWHDGSGRLFHLNSITPAGTWADCIIVIRESENNGVTWSAPKLITKDHSQWCRLIAGTIGISLKTSDGKEGDLIIYQPCDAGGSEAATRLCASSDGGKNWDFKDNGVEPSEYVEGQFGSLLAGVHGSIAEGPEGTLIGVGRNAAVSGKMPLSYSSDGGSSWKYKTTPFLPIGSGQRNVLLRTLEGSLLLISFTHEFPIDHDGMGDYDKEGIEIVDDSGNVRRVFGLFVSLSYDNGDTWAVSKILSDERKAEYMKTGDSAPNLKGFWMDHSRAEHAGYMAACQTPDGTIHVISSHWYYRFNTSWIHKPMNNLGEKNEI